MAFALIKPNWISLLFRLLSGLNERRRLRKGEAGEVGAIRRLRLFAGQKEEAAAEASDQGTEGSY